MLEVQRGDKINRRLKNKNRNFVILAPLYGYFLNFNIHEKS